MRGGLWSEGRFFIYSSQIYLDVYYYLVFIFFKSKVKDFDSGHRCAAGTCFAGEYNKINALLTGVNKELPESPLNTKFLEWFVGLCEAESNFLIRIRKNAKEEVSGFEFVFRISLHKDDVKVLEYIKNTLGCGRLNTERDVLIFSISQLSDIERVLIPIFDKFTLNTSKYLDYLEFKKAFFMFRNRKSSELTLQEINLNIIKLKEGMNSQRVNFSLPVDHNIVITGNYLVGLLEGDGSFYLNKHDMTAHVSLVTTTVNRLVLEKIREFILSLLDEHSYMLGSTTKLINISNKKIKSGHRPISILEISQIDFICNVLIPYLDSIEFRTKKYQDYLDFKTIALLILEGKYLTNKGKELIIDLGNSMNNNRLSTNPNPFILDDNTKSELNILIKSDPLISIDSEGRAMVITEKKYIRSTYIIKVCLLNGLVNYFTSGISCAKFLHVSNDSITKRLNDGKPVKNKEGLVVAQWIKRIKVYSSLK